MTDKTVLDTNGRKILLSSDPERNCFLIIIIMSKPQGHSFPVPQTFNCAKETQTSIMPCFQTDNFFLKIQCSRQDRVLERDILYRYPLFTSFAIFVELMIQYKCLVGKE